MSTRSIPPALSRRSLAKLGAVGAWPVLTAAQTHPSAWQNLNRAILADAVEVYRDTGNRALFGQQTQADILNMAYTYRMFIHYLQSNGLLTGSLPPVTSDSATLQQVWQQFEAAHSQATYSQVQEFYESAVAYQDDVAAAVDHRSIGTLHSGVYSSLLYRAGTQPGMPFPAAARKPILREESCFYIDWAWKYITIAAIPVVSIELPPVGLIGLGLWAVTRVMGC